MTPTDDDSEVGTGRTSNPLAPLFERAARAAAVESNGTTPVHMTVVDDDWLLLSADDAELAEHGRWIASDGHVDLDDLR
jgi:hypothetical protein